jgi:hypothetical protein
VSSTASLWFVVPAHGRTELAAICLEQLRRTCDALTAEGLEATAVVISDDENLDTARELGFGTVERDNRFLSRRFNDGIQLACDPRFNARPVDFVVPIGSDDWIDYRILLQPLPRLDEFVAFTRLAFVREDGLELSRAHVEYDGGCGIRIYPRRLLGALGYRPADEDRERGCDTSILVNLRKAVRHLRVAYRDVHALQIVDFKSADANLNTYRELRRYRARGSSDVEPWAELEDVYPLEAVAAMRAHYAARDRELVA